MSVTGSAASPDLNCLKGRISSLSIDNTLSVAGACADAKAVGEALAELRAMIEELKE